MFPNFCFTRSPNNSGYQVERRTYVPREPILSARPTERSPGRSAGRSTCRSTVRSTGRSSAHSTVRPTPQTTGRLSGRTGNQNHVEPTKSFLLRTAMHNIEAMDTLRGSNPRRKKRVRKVVHSTSPRRTAGHSKTPQASASRNVNSQLQNNVTSSLSNHSAAITGSFLPKVISSGTKTPIKCEMTPKTAEIKGLGTTFIPVAQTKPTSCPPNANRQLQESCADFFNVVHDNVLETVQTAVERMVCKYFQDTTDQMNALVAKINKQEALLNKVHREIMDKIAEQNETSINQFKFVAQMLIDSQTVHYRALHNQHQQRQRLLRQRSEMVNGQYTDVRCEGGDDHQQSQVVNQVSKSDIKQYLVRQQQQQPEMEPQRLSTPPLPPPSAQPSPNYCRCSATTASMSKSPDARRLPAKPVNIRRLQKGASSTCCSSLPNLHSNVALCPERNCKKQVHCSSILKSSRSTKDTEPLRRSLHCLQTQGEKERRTNHISVESHIRSHHTSTNTNFIKLNKECSPLPLHRKQRCRYIKARPSQINVLDHN